MDLAKYKDDNNMGLILEVDLGYPKKLHDTHNIYPLALEQLAVTSDMLSDYCNCLFDMSSGMVENVVPNLMDKTKYTLHYRNLQLYLDLDLKIKKVHRSCSSNSHRG